MSEIIALIGASLAWFTPLAAVRVYENAYGLGYTSVNTACLTMTLAFVPVLSLLYLMLPYPKCMGIVASISSLIGILTLFISQYMVESLQPGAQYVFWISIALIGFNFADNLVKALVSAIGQGNSRLQLEQSLNANRSASLAILGLPVGMLGALMITEVFYDVKNTYFTNEVEAMSVCSTQSAILLGITLVTDFWGIFFDTNPWNSSAESPITVKASFGDWLIQAGTPRTFFTSLQLSLAISALFIGVMQPENLTNTFRFTSQDSKVLLTYYVIGIALGCIAFPNMLETFGTTWKTLWVFNAVFWAGCGLMLFFIADDQVNMVLTCICQAMMGMATMGAILTNLNHMSKNLTEKSMSERNAYLSCVIGLSGLVAGGLCFLMDFLYYIDRNTLIWAYLESSAFPAGALLLNLILHYFTGELFPIASVSRTTTAKNAITTKSI